MTIILDLTCCLNGIKKIQMLARATHSLTNFLNNIYIKLIIKELLTNMIIIKKRKQYERTRKPDLEKKYEKNIFLIFF